MKQRYTLEIGFLSFAIAVSLVGFSSLALGARRHLDAYHVLHIVTSLAWLVLLLSQLVLLRRLGFRRHRTIGLAIFVAGPVLVASLSLLTVHSAAKDAGVGRADMLVVQNVTFALEVALLILLAFMLRHRPKVHGALLLSTALMFLAIALFFTLVSYVPGYRAEGSLTAPRFAAAAQASALTCSVIGLVFFLKDWRNGWPWLLTATFFSLNGYLQMLVDQIDRTKPLTVLVASIGRVPAVALGLTISLAVLGAAWRVKPAARTGRRLSTEPTGA
jgi:hypothetical protein